MLVFTHQTMWNCEFITSFTVYFAGNGIKESKAYIQTETDGGQFGLHYVEMITNGALDAHLTR